jgi:pimeloyl-ACP methyl ester carboxylesterase
VQSGGATDTARSFFTSASKTLVWPRSTLLRINVPPMHQPALDSRCNPSLRRSRKSRSEKSQAAGRQFLKRFRLRTQNRDPEVDEKVAPAQIEAIGNWGAPREKPFEYLNSIRQPTLVVNGDNDVIIYSVNSSILQRHLPNAQLILYPDASHGSQYQYLNRFVQHVSLFLSEEQEL